MQERFDSLRKSLGVRQVLLQRWNDANEALKVALDGFGIVLGEHSSEISAAKKRSLYRLANELVRRELPPAELFFHKQFDKLADTLVDRRSLLERRGQAREALNARYFNAALVDRIDIVAQEASWSKASASLWPLSVWRKQRVKKKLKSFMSAEGLADPEVDLPLFREYRDLCDKLTENMALLGLPRHLQTEVEKDVFSLDKRVESARHLREVFHAVGLSPDNVPDTARASLEPLTLAARRLYPPGREVERLRGELRDNLTALGLSPELQVFVEQDATALDAVIQSAERLRDATAALGLPNEQVFKTLQSVLAAPIDVRQQVAARFCQCARAFQTAWQDYTKSAAAMPVAKDSFSIVGDAAAQAERVLTGRTLLKQWTAWVAARHQAEMLGLGAFVEAIFSGQLATKDAASRFELAYARWWLPHVVDQSEPLRAFQRFRHEAAIEDFCRLDELARNEAGARSRQGVFHGLPVSDQVPRRSELGLLRHQMGLKRPSKSIREIIAGMPDSFGKLAPCLLMSPLSIAQYLPAEQTQFDVVVFDEASQIVTWDAIGAIARGKQTIIVGDPKQLPPTNFFGRADGEEDNDEIDDFEKDLESILDEAQASGLPTLQLNWHYRSRHESLIAFSNWNYYGNQLVTFPAAETNDRGVSLTHVDGGIYDRGKSRTNRREAEAIVADAVARMSYCLTRPESERLTYGVVTFNSQQQSLIQDLFDQALRNAPELEWFFSDDRIEPTAVKNLENVQGDERDVMFFSITFGFDAAGKFPVDFGAINRNGGERRLNVAVTRARQSLVVYTSFLPDQLRAERSAARGVRDLKAFLEYAQKGPIAIAARTDGSAGTCESPFEEAVAQALVDLGWQVEPQIGVSGFRVDLGIVHPDRPGAYLAGVECDGATYHRSVTARDRDKTRQQVLEKLGWRILRVWSPDWWYDPKQAIEHLHVALNKELEKTRQATPQEGLTTDPEVATTQIGVEQIEAPNDERFGDDPANPKAGDRLCDDVRKVDGQAKDASRGSSLDGI